MNKEEIELGKCEEDLLNNLVVSILFMNAHGMAIPRVREMIIDALDRAIRFYMDENVLEGLRKKQKEGKIV